VRNKSNDYRRYRTSMYSYAQHQRPEGKRGAHKLKRLAWREEIATLVEVCFEWRVHMFEVCHLIDVVLLFLYYCIRTLARGIYGRVI
jgi:hypothetical protein